MSIRFDAPITITLSSVSTPSSSAKNCGTMVVSTSDDTPDPRVRSNESISSMNTITGLPSAARSRARLKIMRINRSDSPTNLLSSSGPFTDRNTPLPPAAPSASALATALAIREAHTAAHLSVASNHTVRTVHDVGTAFARHREYVRSARPNRQCRQT